MKINASNTANLTIECTADSACYGFELMHGPTGRFNLNCNASASCQYSIINVEYSDHIDIYCDSNQTTSSSDSWDLMMSKIWKYSCRGIDVVAVNAESVTMDCTAGCYEPSVRLRNVSDFWMECGHWSCYAAFINISYSESVNISCAPGDIKMCLGQSEFHFNEAGAISMTGTGNGSFLQSEVNLYGDRGNFSMHCMEYRSCFQTNIRATYYKRRYNWKFLYFYFCMISN